MPAMGFNKPGCSRPSAVADTSEYDVLVTKVTQHVMKDGKKMKKVSSFYQQYLPPVFSKEEADNFANRFYKENYRVVVEYFEVNSS